VSDTTRRILLTKIRDAGFIGFTGVIATFIGLVAGVESLYAKYIMGDSGIEALSWSLWLVSSLYLLIGLSVFCGISQLKLSDELDRVIEARNDLEDQILNRRRSSRRRKKR